MHGHPNRNYSGSRNAQTRRPLWSGDALYQWRDGNRVGGEETVMLLSIVFGLFLQVPVNIPANNPVVVGLKDGQKLALDSAQFTGFIETREGGDVLLYRQK